MPPVPDANAARVLQEHRIVLAYPRPPAARGVLDRLARFMDLETYGDSLLTRGARSGLRTQASLLTIVFLFDVAVWSVMFNMLFGLGYLHVGWHTVLAVIAALLVAWVMFLWERNIATLDIDKGIGGRLWLGIGARVAIVAVAALATAVPLDIVLLNKEIRQRAYEEAVRHEFVLKWREQRDLESTLREYARNRDDLAAKAPSEDDVDPQRKARMAQLQNEESRVRKEADAAREQIITVPAEQRASWEAKARSANLALANVRQEISQLGQAMRNDVTEAQARRLKEKDDAIACMRERHQALEDWLHKIRKHDFARDPDLEWPAPLPRCAPPQPSAAAAPADTASRIDFRLSVPTLRLSDQVRILLALQMGAPPEWRDADDDLIKELQSRYNLKDKASSATKVYGAFALIGLFVGIAIPLMSLMFKLIGNQETKHYYSFAAQARAGNPEALHVLASQE